MNGMEPMSTNTWWGLALVLLLASPSTSGAAELKPNDPLNPPGLIYWCPNRTPDQQYSKTPAPGCSPLVDEADKQRAAERETQGEKKAGTPVKIQNIQSDVSKFIQQYRQFLDCCANDVDSLAEVEKLHDQAFELLKAIQDMGLLNMVAGTNQRQFTTSEIIRPVVQARDDLRKLKTRLEQIRASKEKLDRLDFEAAARERRRIQEQEESLKQEFRPIRPPESARTGMEVEDTTLPNRFGTTIQDTTLPNAFGANIGDVASPHSDPKAGLNFRRGPDTQDTTLPNYHVGPDTQDTTLPYSFGFEVGTKENPGGASTTPSRVGPAVGDSSLNKRP